MIGASDRNGDGFTQRMLARAYAFASARAQRRKLANALDPSHWRRADLVWPLFGKER